MAPPTSLLLAGNGNRRTEGGDFLAVLDEPDSHTFADGRVGLLGFDADLFEHDALGVRATSEGRRLECGSEKSLLVVEIGPSSLTAMVAQLARGVESSWFAFAHRCCDVLC